MLASYIAGAHAVLILGQAGCQLSKNLVVPDNLTLLPLPPGSPELNPVENAWQYLREHWLSNWVFPSHDDIIALCCDTWNRLIECPLKIMSIDIRDWADEF